ncbi:MAG: D-glycero-beta-D-manno-heptose-7-phosphate kinase [Nanoarchaeota archaeon]
MSSPIRTWTGKRILAIGDVMLDSYLDGDVSRISPEAPVPVLHVQQERSVPGGIGNTAMNCAALGGKVTVLGVIGKDSAGAKLKAILGKHGVDTRNLVIDPERPTTKKVRVITRQQQMLRIDYEKERPISPAIETELRRRALRLLHQSDAVIISDYAKGTVTEALAKEVIASCNRKGLPVVIDPKPEHMSFFSGATVIKPNSLGASRMAGYPITNQEEALRAGRELLSRLSANILITQGERGMTLFERSGRVTSIPTQAKEVFDVSGAGDTAAAVMALALAAKLPLAEAAIIANQASGIVVGKVGTAIVTQEELAGIMESESSKLKTLPELVRIVQDLKRKGKRIVWTNGCFDILHPGHTRYLAEARKLGDVLILGLNTDASVRKLKGPERPILNETERAEVLSALCSINYLLFFSEETPIRQLKALMPDVIAKGGDYTVEQVVGHELMEKSGGKVVIIPLLQGYSTSSIISKIKHGKSNLPGPRRHHQ